MDVVAEARAAESIGISFQNPLVLAMGRFRSEDSLLKFVAGHPEPFESFGALKAVVRFTRSLGVRYRGGSPPEAGFGADALR